MATAVSAHHQELPSESSPTHTLIKPLSSPTAQLHIRHPPDAPSQDRPSSPPVRTEEPDPRQSLQHVLAPNDESAKSPVQDDSFDQATSTKTTKTSVIWIHEGGKERAEDEPSVQNDSYTRAAEVNPSYTMTVAHTRRNANGTVGSVYSGNKIRHLKKEDGIPLWRKDIQFAFLRAVFDDETRVFTMASDGSKGHTFSEIYIDAMARSSKTSKILKEKLLSERSAALNMAMVCLLVNVGRMNTTLNFFPEMRAQLRTYHSIPSLQAHQDPIAYKQLQDAPRLKSILKGASEDANQPSTVDKIKALPVPRTNPVNLIFVLSQYAPKISETHFHAPRDFFDLVMRGTLSSKSRANAFLWLIWFYLESDYSGHAASTNPFGPGQHGEATGGLPLKVPAFEHLTEEQANAENVDTAFEKAYGEMKRQERKRILEEDATVGPPLKKAKKGDNLYGSNALNEHVHSDTDRTQSPSPLGGDNHNLQKVTHYDFNAGLNGTREIRSAAHSGIGEGPGGFSDYTPSQRLILKTRPYRPQGSSPVPGRSSPQLPVNSVGAHVPGSRRSRPETSHQKAVNMNRKKRIDYIIHQKLSQQHGIIRQRREVQRRTTVFRAMRRIRNLPDDYASSNEDSWGPGGLLPNADEDEDYGAEALELKKVLDRAVRRLEREAEGRSANGFGTDYRKRKRKLDDHLAEDEQLGPSTGKQYDYIENHRGTVRSNGKLDNEIREGTLDELDLDLLGESRDEEQMDEELDDDSGEDDSDDLTEDEAMEHR